MDKKGGDGGRVEGKEKRVEEKEVEKREKGKKWFWEMSFLFLFDCVFASSPFFIAPTHHTTRPQHTLTLTHHTPHNTTHWCTPSHANRAVCCAAFFFSQSILWASASPSWQCAIHRVSKERGGDYRAMASCQCVMSEG